jgi:hypothetical protein
MWATRQRCPSLSAGQASYPQPRNSKYEQRHAAQDDNLTSMLATAGGRGKASSSSAIGSSRSALGLQEEPCPPQGRYSGADGAHARRQPGADRGRLEPAAHAHRSTFVVSTASCVAGCGRSCASRTRGPALAAASPTRRAGPRSSCAGQAVRPRGSLTRGEPLPMRKTPTGESYAGKPPVRFGGRGGFNPSRSLSHSAAAMIGSKEAKHEFSG